MGLESKATKSSLWIILSIGFQVNGKLKNQSYRSEIIVGLFNLLLEIFLYEKRVESLSILSGHFLHFIHFCAKCQKLKTRIAKVKIDTNGFSANWVVVGAFLSDDNFSFSLGVFCGIFENVFCLSTTQHLFVTAVTDYYFSFNGLLISTYSVPSCFIDLMSSFVTLPPCNAWHHDVRPGLTSRTSLEKSQWWEKIKGWLSN